MVLPLPSHELSMVLIPIQFRYISHDIYHRVRISVVSAVTVACII